MKPKEMKRLVRNSVFLNTQIVITNNQSMIIETCKRILEYNDICLKLLTNTGLTVQIWGKKLSMSECSNDDIIISGTIDSVEFFLRRKE